ncbi:hypothetical protein DPM19_21280 [Actinomadura craniellae]|uniref:Uncharacterized protein n=1 Tax=Actinomadura craniellae TaxID=2231787 RepID=A0A365H1S0_9ACTN|nr:hypothetical protein [Actinomadura craniellae]RAY13040.1 hypothetical protein DPM19_21280 [Actinomadura craniellae]
MELDWLGDALQIVGIGASVGASTVASISLKKNWRYRALRNVWGFGRRDRVMVVCTELDDPETRQFPEPREFIYSYKYGDLDALFEVVTTLLRLFPALELRVVSYNELDRSQLDLDSHLVLIGGPDYNKVTERILEEADTCFDYLSPYSRQPSRRHPDEIVLLARESGDELFFTTDKRDYGYFETLDNIYAEGKRIVLIGGCHTLGVTGAAKTFSVLNVARQETREIVLRNANRVWRHTRRKKRFAVLVEAHRVGTSISTPQVKTQNIWSP